MSPLMEPTGEKFAMKIGFAVASSSQSKSYASTWSALKFVGVGYLELKVKLKKIIALLRLAIGSSVRRKVTELVVGLLECLIGSVDMVDKLHMVENDTVCAESCMREVGCRYWPVKQVDPRIIVAFLKLH
ncbi:hypothetical protein Tco_1229802 [Tanacetum coccineum]